MKAKKVSAGAIEVPFFFVGFRKKDIFKQLRLNILNWLHENCLLIHIYFSLRELNN
jgi:hypothetical protein